MAELCLGMSRRQDSPQHAHVFNFRTSKHHEQWIFVAIMLVKANYGGTKKYIKLQEACFSDFLSAVQEKFLIPETTTLKVTDDQGVESLHLKNHLRPLAVQTRQSIVDCARTRMWKAKLPKSHGYVITLQLPERAINKSTKEFHALGIVSLFPSLKDPYSKKGYILQDFLLMFGAEAASRLLEKWNTSFKEKVIQEAQSLKGSTLLRKYLKAALNEESDTPEEP
ncbi:hypothetical protein FQA47_000577, partial [Oryzias melastigma]